MRTSYMVQTMGRQLVPYNNNWFDELKIRFTCAVVKFAPDHYWLSNCCGARALGEMDSGQIWSYLDGPVPYRLGLCSKCKDNTVFFILNSADY